MFENIYTYLIALLFSHCVFFFLLLSSRPNGDPNQQLYQFERPRFSNLYNDKNNNRSSSSSSSNSDEEQFPFAAEIFAEEANDIESDDFYGRTREIIIFAEKGNKQPATQ